MPSTENVANDDAISGGINDARNSAIFNMFSLISVGERSGIGLCDVYSAWKANGYKEPEFVETVDPDRITLTLEIEVRDKTAENVANNVANVANDVANVATVINGYTLTESEKSVYEFIVSHVNASTKEISEATGVTVRTVQRSIKELENHQIIKKAGTRTRVEWIIL